MNATTASRAAVVLAFPATYYLPLLSGTRDFIALRHLHGAASAWWSGIAPRLLGP